jgi:hypothetical protein
MRRNGKNQEEIRITREKRELDDMVRIILASVN